MNDIDSQPVPSYAEHPGTIRVAGKSPPATLAHCMQTMISQGVDPIDFFCIGANAGHQATKAMTIVSYQIAEESNKAVDAVFKPLRMRTTTRDPINGKFGPKDAIVWRLVLLR